MHVTAAKCRFEFIYFHFFLTIIILCRHRSWNVLIQHIDIYILLLYTPTFEWTGHVADGGDGDTRSPLNIILHFMLRLERARVQIENEMYILTNDKSVLQFWDEIQIET